MQKPASRGSGITRKGKSVPKTIDEYLANVSEPARSTLNRIRATIRSIAPAETTEGISYRIPTFNYKGPLVGLAAFSNHCSLFPMSASLIKAFKNELKEYQNPRGRSASP